MATAARSTTQEYWRPSNPDVARVVTSIRGTCQRCGTDYAGGARYCHTCGMARDSLRGEGFLEAETMQEESRARAIDNSLGLSTPCAVCFVVGILCAAAAVLSGVIYKADTLVDWQAVQAWRVEWLLGAIASLLAGILLKRKNGST
jgi:hypothetical protein